MRNEDAESERAHDDWEAFERRFRAAYEATPPGAPHIVMPSSLPLQRISRLRRYGWIAACLVAGTIFFSVAQRPARHESNQAATTVLSVVQFALNAPEAKRVTVVGDFNQWDPHASPLAQDADGRWQMGVPMQPGRHEYAFVIDNHRWVTDPLAPRAPDLGFGPPNSVVLAATVRQ